MFLYAGLGLEYSHSFERHKHPAKILR